MSVYLLSYNYKYIVRRVFQSNFATLELLKSSILVSLSGIFRVYLAGVLLQTEVSVLTCLAGGLIIYSVYTLDRALGSEEDMINRGELTKSSKKVGLIVTLFSFLAGAYLFSKEGILALAFLPFVTGYLYSKGIKIGRYSLRLKGGLGVKNLVVGFTWGLSIVGTACHDVSNFIPLVIVFILYFGKTFCNSVLDDFKDLKGDSLAGLQTLPVCFGKKRTRKFLLGIHLIIHLITGFTLLCGYIAFEPVIIVCSFVFGIICILEYTKGSKYRGLGKIGRTVFKDCESPIIAILLLTFHQ